MRNEEVREWHKSIMISRLKENFSKRNIDFFYVEKKEEVIDVVRKYLKKRETVSFGGSVTLQEVGLLDFLENGEYNLLDRRKKETAEERTELYRQTFFADSYFLSANAITVDGEILNVDGNGNRIAAMIFGPKQVFVIVGINKLVNNMEEAYKRLEQYAGPKDAKILGKNTPCTATGECMDCKSPDRICNKYLVYKRENIKDRMKIIMVNENLGF